MEKKKKNIATNTGKGHDRVSVTMTVLYAFFLLFAVAIFYKIIKVQAVYSVKEELSAPFKPQDEKAILEPKRGNILDINGNYLAIQTCQYQVRMDCEAMKADYRRIVERAEKKAGDPESWKGLSKQKIEQRERMIQAAKDTAAAREKRWRDQVPALAEGLSRIYGDMTAAQYADTILANRDGKRPGRRSKKIGGVISQSTLNEVTALPLFKKGPNYGGIIIDTFKVRQYPFNPLANRTIGKANIGIEGSDKYNPELSGTQGIEYLKVVDHEVTDKNDRRKKERVRDPDQKGKPVEDGKDVRLTLDINYQDILDRALRKQVEDDKDVDEAIALLMDVKTGGIRAMVNLKRTAEKGDTTLREQYNYAVGNLDEPGSVFKTVLLSALIEDGYVKNLNQTIHCAPGSSYRGVPIHHDGHVGEWGTIDVPVWFGLRRSSNTVFEHMLVRYYGSHPEKYYEKLSFYGLDKAFPFDLDGMKNSQIRTNKDSGWSPADFRNIAFGYSIAVAPIQILRFYNAIANGGIMVDPYLVETPRKTPVRKKAIFSAETAKMLTEGLKSVTDEHDYSPKAHGTAYVLYGTPVKVAGKTGTARVSLTPAEHRKSNNHYESVSGLKKHLGSFVGFFPADNPKYTIFVSVHTRLTAADHYGGTVPAMTTREVVNTIYALEDNGKDIHADKEMPQLAASAWIPVEGKVPDVKGLGLSEALYRIEKSGFHCSFEGHGHAVSQSVAAGSSPKEDKTIHIVLK